MSHIQLKDVDALIAKYRLKTADVEPGFTINFLGVKSNVGWYGSDMSRFSGQPNKIGLQGPERLEFAALLNAFESRRGASFDLIELGAAWGPWIASGNALCKAADEKITYTASAVEANPGQIHKLKQNVILNEITNCKVFEGVVWGTSGTAKFPKTGAQDFGAGAANSVEEFRAKDSQRSKLEMMDVAAFSLSDILNGRHNNIDFLHVDIQGAEFDILSKNIDLLKSRFRSVMVATHSRFIEGNILKMFFDLQWDIPIERPCDMTYRKNASALEKMTTTDGIIFATNPQLF